MSNMQLSPRLVVAGADAAIDFYRKVFGAELLERYRDEGSRRVLHAALRIGDAILSLTDDAPADGNEAPPSLGGSPVLFTVVVDDPDAVGERFVREGGEVRIPIDDRFYGKREGRFADPFGHLWILSRPIRDRSSRAT